MRGRQFAHADQFVSNFNIMLAFHKITQYSI